MEMIGAAKYGGEIRRSGLTRSCSQKTKKNHVILNGAQWSEVKNLGGFKAEILRCAQNDKKSLLIAH
jgi:hypothetical protein